MECPVCKGVNLVMADRQGIEIDYCPTCRGVWLDRGELDKIIERSAGSMPAGQTLNPPPQQQPYPPPQQNPYPQSHQQQHHHQHQGYYKKKKRGGFLEDLFDFD